MSADVLRAIAVAAELTGTELSVAALRVMEQDLEGYPERDVIAAIGRCRVELTGRLTLAAIIERLDKGDGRPSADEAWALALNALDESETVVWTDEAREAFSVARPVLEGGDKVGARMAFKAAYERIISNARADKRRPAWDVSLGWDAQRREAVLQRAAIAGILTYERAQALMPPAPGGVVCDAIFSGKVLKAPEGNDDAKRTAEWCKRLLEQVKSGGKQRAA